jgi:hypothetical protein
MGRLSAAHRFVFVPAVPNRVSYAAMRKSQHKGTRFVWNFGGNALLHHGHRVDF